MSTITRSIALAVCLFAPVSASAWTLVAKGSHWSAWFAAVGESHFTPVSHDHAGLDEGRQAPTKVVRAMCVEARQGAGEWTLQRIDGSTTATVSIGVDPCAEPPTWASASGER